MMNNIHHMNIYSSCKLCLYFYIKTSKTLSCMDILPIVPCMIQNKNIEQPDSILSNPAVFIALTHLFYLASAFNIWSPRLACADNGISILGFLSASISHMAFAPALEIIISEAAIRSGSSSLMYSYCT